MNRFIPLLAASLSQLIFALNEIHIANDARELNVALATLNPGDIVMLRNGEWKDVTIHFEKNGLPERPITLRAQDPGKVTLTGSSSVDFAGDWLVVEGLKFQNLRSDRVFVRFLDGADNCRLTESAILDSSNERRSWVHMGRGVSNRIDHCTFSGMNHIGVQLQIETETHRPNHHRIDNNLFANRERGNGNGFETVRIGYSHQQTNYSGTTFERNLFYRCNGENEVVSNKSTGNRFIQNTFLECMGELTLRHGDKAWVEGNWFIGNGVRGSSGVRIIGADHVVVNNYFQDLQSYAILLRNGVETDDPKSYTQVKNALVAFNTIVNCGKGIVVGSGAGTLPPMNSRIANNLLQQPSGNDLEQARALTGITYEGNATSSSGAVPGFMKGMITLQPADGIVRPTPSPSLQIAVEGYEQIVRDISGNARSGSRDVGAQLAGGSRSVTPLKPNETGPAWMRTR